MNTLEAIQSRRAVKHFDPAHKMTEAEVKQLLELAILAPTAFNIQNWRLVNVTDPALRQQIREVAWGQAQVTDASLMLVLTADLKSWEKDPARYWRNAPDEVKGFMVPAIYQYYRDKEQVQRDEAMRSCGIIGQTIIICIDHCRSIARSWIINFSIRIYIYSSSFDYINYTIII